MSLKTHSQFLAQQAHMRRIDENINDDDEDNKETMPLTTEYVKNIELPSGLV